MSGRRPGRVTPHEQWHGHVFQGAEFGQQVMELIYETQRPVAQRTLAIIAQPRHRLTADPDLACRGLIEAAEQLQQRALARAGGPDDGEPVSPVHPKIDALQNFKRSVGFAEALDQAFDQEHRFTHIAAPPPVVDATH